jgi:hypothetical protein
MRRAALELCKENGHKIKKGYNSVLQFGVHAYTELIQHVILQLSCI